MGTVEKSERVLRRLFQAVVEIIKKKLPQATLIDFHGCGSFHSACRPTFFLSQDPENRSKTAHPWHRPRGRSSFKDDFRGTNFGLRSGFDPSNQ